MQAEADQLQLAGQLAGHPGTSDTLLRKLLSATRQHEHRCVVRQRGSARMHASTPACHVARTVHAAPLTSWHAGRALALRRSPGVEAALLRGLLVKLMAAAQPVDGAAVGEVLRGLLQASPGDADKLRLYRCAPA